MRRTPMRRRKGVVPAAARAHECGLLATVFGGMSPIAECGLQQYSEACPQYLKLFGALRGPTFSRVGVA